VTATAEVLARVNELVKAGDVRRLRRVRDQLRAAKARRGSAGWRSPGELAAAIDPSTVQTPALDLIDAALVDIAEGRCDRLIITMPPQEGKPVTVASMILMGDGSRSKLGDVQVGDTVITHLGRPKTVTAVHDQGFLPVVTITTHAGRTVTAALDHPFLTPAGWVNAGDLEVGDSLATVMTPQTTPTATLTPEAARLMGYFIGDGSTTEYERGSGRTSNASITCFDDLETEDILRCVEALGFEARWTAGSKKRIGISKGVRPWLRIHGMAGATSRTKRVPVEIFTQTPEVIAEFIGAYFACDGTVSKRGGARPDARLEFNSVSRDLLADVQHLLLRLGIQSTLRAKNTIYRGEPYVSWRLLMRRQDDVYRFRALVPVHHAKAQTLRDWPLRRTEFDAPLATDPIAAIERGEEAECRCLTVEDDHTFTAEDLVVHNSTRVTTVGPLWLLTRNPDLRVAIACYAQDLADEFGRTIRNHITANDGEEGALDLGLRIAPDNGAARRWRLDLHRGGARSVGITSGLTGKPVDVLFIDDPIKDQQDADSAAWRKVVWDFWTAVANTRLAPGAPVVVILTRWHEDDLAGRLLAAEDAHRWRVLNIPAQADHDPVKGEVDPLGREPGQYLTSARGRTVRQWEQIRVAVGSRVWNALYQGRPSPAEGGILKREWWRTYDRPRWIVRDDGSYWAVGADEVIQSWDMAFKSTDGSDFVCGQVWARYGLQATLLDQVHERLSFVETRKAVRELAAKWPQATLKLVEDKANGPAVINSLSQIVAGLVPEEPHGSKPARASAVAPFIEAGQVWLPAPELAPWVGAFVAECAAFPTGSHDDQVDAMSQAINRLLLSPLLAGDQIVGADDLDDWGGGGISPY